jgi:hypothetical protein
MEMVRPTTRIQVLNIYLFCAVIEAPISALWNGQIITANTECVVNECVGDNSRH